MELAERPAVMSYYRTVPPLLGGNPPRQLPGIVYSLPPKGAGTSVASQLPCECRFLESVSWAVQPHFLSEILASGFHHSAPRHNLGSCGGIDGNHWEKAITDCFTWVGPGQGASNHNERRIGTRYLYHIGGGGQARTTFLEF